jgi:hypothetical protein
VFYVYFPPLGKTRVCWCRGGRHTRHCQPWKTSSYTIKCLAKFWQSMECVLHKAHMSLQPVKQCIFVHLVTSLKLSFVVFSAFPEEHLSNPSISKGSWRWLSSKTTTETCPCHSMSSPFNCFICLLQYQLWSCVLIHNLVNFSPTRKYPKRNQQWQCRTTDMIRKDSIEKKVHQIPLANMKDKIVFGVYASSQNSGNILNFNCRNGRIQHWHDGNISWFKFGSCEGKAFVWCCWCMPLWSINFYDIRFFS